ncbi:MAG: hypothetical protein Q7S75_00680 [bacterium]|nr:hypothetical protein [bacterium]
MQENTKALVWAAIALVVGLALGYMLWGGSSSYKMQAATSATTVNAAASSEKEIALYSAMRKLWSDHVFWTREYITTFAAGDSEAAGAAATRLMKNQEDIGAAVGQFYGASAGNALTALLKQHISIAVELLSEAKKKDTAKFNDANTRWQRNADDIATFLSQANPNWPLATLKEMMAMHLKTTTDEAVAALGGNYTGSVTAFDKVFDHISTMSDALSVGIITQFPDKFK